MKFDPAQYLTLKPSVKSLAIDADNNILNVSTKQFSSLTGEALADDVTPVDLTFLRQQIASFQDFINNAQTLINDAGLGAS